MISSSNIKLHKNWKIVRKIKINEVLKKEIEEILIKQIIEMEEEDQGYYINMRIKSIFSNGIKNEFC